MICCRENQEISMQPLKGEIRMTNLFKRLIREDDGMEMIEWAIVGVVFAVAAAAFWGTLSGAVDGALQDIAAEVDPGSAP
jgi:Flp pilus assembly pilin Flp